MTYEELLVKINSMIHADDLLCGPLDTDSVHANDNIQIALNKIWLVYLLLYNNLID